MENLSNEQRVAHWSKTKALMVKSLVVWFIFSFFIHFFVDKLNNFTGFLSFPFGFYMAAQGSLIVFVITIFVYAKKQNEIDEEFGVSED